MTNKKLNDILSENPATAVGNKSHLNTFSLMELDAYLGLLILTGVFRANKEPINELYSEDPNKSRTIFKATMPRERLKSFSRYLRFDDYSTRMERLKTDKLAPIRWVFESVKSSLFKYYSPGTFLTIDELLARYRGMCSFRQYPIQAWEIRVKVVDYSRLENILSISY